MSSFQITFADGPMATAIISQSELAIRGPITDADKQDSVAEFIIDHAHEIAEYLVGGES